MRTPKPPKDPNRPKRRATGSYEVGYCRPPVSGQTKHGEVRNPFGPKGRPKEPSFDPFEYAASQITHVTINGEKMEIAAETAMHLVMMNAAVSGKPAAQKLVLAERRARRSSSTVKTAQELQQDRDENVERERISASIVNLLEEKARRKKESSYPGNEMASPTESN